MFRLLTLALALVQEATPDPTPAYLASGVTILVPSRTSNPKTEPPKKEEKQEEKKEEEKKETPPDSGGGAATYQPPWMGEALQSPDTSFAALPALCLEADSAPPARSVGTAYDLDDALGNLVTDEKSPSNAEPGTITVLRIEDLRLRSEAVTVDLFSALRDGKVEAGVAVTQTLRLWLVLKNKTDRPLLVVVPRGSVVEFEEGKARVRAHRTGSEREKAALRAFDAFAKLAAGPPRAWKESHATLPDEFRLPLEHWYFWILTKQRTHDDLRAALLAEARAAGVSAERRAAVVAEIAARARVACDIFMEACR